MRLTMRVRFIKKEQREKRPVGRWPHGDPARWKSKLIERLSRVTDSGRGRKTLKRLFM